MIYPSILNGLPSVTVRFYQDSDFDQAHRIIRSIGTTYLGNNLHSWNHSFQEINGFIWVGCIDAVPVAFAGLTPSHDGFATLHTDLVDPCFQRMKLGTLLTLTRFASMDPDEIGAVGVIATDHSAAYYQRFGFSFEDQNSGESHDGQRLHRLSRNFTPEIASLASEILDNTPNVHFDLFTEPDLQSETEE